jgi:hypothetical protein
MTNTKMVMYKCNGIHILRLFEWTVNYKSFIYHYKQYYRNKAGKAEWFVRNLDKRVISLLLLLFIFFHLFTFFVSMFSDSCGNLEWTFPDTVEWRIKTSLSQVLFCHQFGKRLRNIHTKLICHMEVKCMC